MHYLYYSQCLAMNYLNIEFLFVFMSTQHVQCCCFDAGNIVSMVEIAFVHKVLAF